ncbi:MAG: hypothetical protein ACI9DC_005384, partial [Gammaproteobacteria bacterium]
KKGCGACNPCAAKKGCGACNPCAAKKGCGACNPCAAKKGCGACNPCAAKKGCGACNPCAAKKGCGACNPCAAKKGCGACNPCAAKKGCGACNPCAAKKGCGACNPCAAKRGCGACNPCNPCGAAKVTAKAFMRPCGAGVKPSSDRALIAEGKRLWNDKSLSRNGLACSTCHQGHGNLNASFAQSYPHPVAMPQQMAGVKQVHADEMVQFCLLVPLQSKALGWSSRELAALTAYTVEFQKGFNPCAAKKNTGGGCGACNPCAAKKRGCNPCNPCAAKKKS